MKSKTLLVISLIILCYGGFAHSASKKSKECKKVTKKIESIQKKMRSGYTSQKGAKYHKQLNKLYKHQFKTCF